MLQLRKESIIEALNIIDSNPELRKGRESIEYDLIINNKNYPPILVISEANKLQGGTDLMLKDLGNSTKQAFKVLKSLGFKIEKKKEEPDQKSTTPKIWIEKTLVAGRQDRLEGEYALGKRLWSPTTSKSGADIYSLMRLVEVDDIVLHLTDNDSFTGISKVKSKYTEGKGVQGSEWEGDAYFIELKDFMVIKPIPRDSILKEDNKTILQTLKATNKVFYNSKLNLNQGAYLTECPLELAYLITKEYHLQNGAYLPFLPMPNLNATTSINLNDEFKFNLFIEALETANLHFSKEIVCRFICALLTKPFVILTGLTGSGKTKLAQAFAQWIVESENQICVIPVGADWTNREPLLGFPNALDSGKYILPDNGALSLLIEANKIENKHKPFFLILDEMNLSHVERYFADFLSTMESSGKIPLHSNTIDWKDSVPYSIELPPNLFIIGTVNIDETTYMFSPKVLDRANVIEFRITENELKKFLNRNQGLKPDLLKYKGTKNAKSFIDIALNKDIVHPEQTLLNDYLMQFFVELKKIGAEFGYRTASEVSRFAAIVKIIEPTWTIEHITDAAVLQKLLPKVHGSRRKLEPILKTLGTLCLYEKQEIEDIIKSELSNSSFEYSNYKFPLALEKIIRMYRTLLQNGFSSYAEA